MGKAQSKRSVDITTTDTKKNADDEVTGKLEKIEDIDQQQQKQVTNGEASPPENAEVGEKKDGGGTEELENDKDLTTEKTSAEQQGAGGDQNSPAATATESPKEDTATATTTTTTTASKDQAAAGAAAGAAAEEISPLADESAKKSKKEKVKKKWSFRSISFGKKDKQKPAKTEETTESAKNGEAATPEKAAEGTEEGASATKVDEAQAAGDADAVAPAAAAVTVEAAPAPAAELKPAEKVENGGATQAELNGQKTPTDEEVVAVKQPTEEATKIAATVDAALGASITEEATTVNIITPESAATVTATPIPNESQTEPEQQQNAVTVTTASIEVAAKTIIVSNGEAAPAAENGNGHHDTEVINENNINDTTKEAVPEVPIAAVPAVVEDCKKIIPNVLNDAPEKPHQNGTNNGAENETEAVAEADNDKLIIEQSKAQIEVNITENNTNTEKNALNTINAAILLSKSADDAAAEQLAADAKLESGSIHISPLSTQTPPPPPPPITDVDSDTLKVESQIPILKISPVNLSLLCEDHLNAKVKQVAEEKVEEEKKEEDQVEKEKKVEVVADVADVADADAVAPATAVQDINVEHLIAVDSIENTECDNIPPPPLPVSPPPSQVSCFALKNDDEDDQIALQVEIEEVDVEVLPEPEIEAAPLIDGINPDIDDLLPMGIESEEIVITGITANMMLDFANMVMNQSPVNGETHLDALAQELLLDLIEAEGGVCDPNIADLNEESTLQSNGVEENETTQNELPTFDMNQQDQGGQVDVDGKGKGKADDVMNNEAHSTVSEELVKELTACASEMITDLKNENLVENREQIEQKGEEEETRKSIAPPPTPAAEIMVAPPRFIVTAVDNIDEPIEAKKLSGSVGDGENNKIITGADISETDDKESKREELTNNINITGADDNMNAINADIEPANIITTESGIVIADEDSISPNL